MENVSRRQFFQGDKSCSIKKHDPGIRSSLKGISISKANQFEQQTETGRDGGKPIVENETPLKIRR